MNHNWDTWPGDHSTEELHSKTMIPSPAPLPVRVTWHLLPLPSQDSDHWAHQNSVSGQLTHALNTVPHLRISFFHQCLRWRVMWGLERRQRHGGLHGLRAGQDQQNVVPLQTMSTLILNVHCGTGIKKLSGEPLESRLQVYGIVYVQPWTYNVSFFLESAWFCMQPSNLYRRHAVCEQYAGTLW